MFFFQISNIVLCIPFEGFNCMAKSFYPKKGGKRNKTLIYLNQHRTLTLIVRLWCAEGARFLCVCCGGYFLGDRLHAFVGGCGTRFVARKSADGDLLASSRGAEKVKAVVLQQGEGKKQHDLRCEFGAVPLLFEPEGRWRQAKDGGAKAQQPKAEGQREQARHE